MSTPDAARGTVRSGLCESVWSAVALARGETAYGDLDATEAALLMNGGVGFDALAAWDVFESAAQLFEQGFSQ
ncbi:MAG: hypothetical protein KIS67_10080 [Verrucomicrobiae bacterium]|nr:hypothetical protein [Verrucomicrobiae bacterium]